MHVIAFLLASSLCNPCSDPDLLPPVVDVGLASAGGGAAALGAVATVLFIPLGLLQLANVNAPAPTSNAPIDPAVVAVAVGAITVVYALGAGIGGGARSSARGFGNPLAVGVVSTVLAAATVGAAFGAGLAVAGGPGSEVIWLGVMAGGTLATGVGAAITAAATE